MRRQLVANAAITAVYTVGGTGASISLTSIAVQANDATLNISLDNGTATGVTTAATSANTTAGVLDTVAGSGIIEFTNIGPSGGFIRIRGTRLRIDAAAIISGFTTMRLHLFDAAPDAIADNAAWDLSSAGDRGKYKGYLDLGTAVDLGSTLYVEVNGSALDKLIKLADGSTSLFGVLTTGGAFTPTALLVFNTTILAQAA